MAELQGISQFNHVGVESVAKRIRIESIGIFDLYCLSLKHPKMIGSVMKYRLEPIKIGLPVHFEWLCKITYYESSASRV